MLFRSVCRGCGGHRGSLALAFFLGFLLRNQGFLSCLFGFAALACVWMYRDAKQQGRSKVSLLPYFMLTAVFVSIGPLLYIVVNGFKYREQP